MAKYDPEIVMEFYADAWPTKKESWISAPGCRANGSPMMKMLSSSSLGIRWSKRRGSNVSTARKEDRSQDLMRRLLASYCAPWDKTLHEAWQEGRCESCALAWQLWHRSGWRFSSVTSFPATIILISHCLNASWSTLSKPISVFM